MASADPLIARPDLLLPPNSFGNLKEASQSTTEGVVQLHSPQPSTAVHEEAAAKAARENSAVLDRGIGLQRAPSPEAGVGVETGVPSLGSSMAEAAVPSAGNAGNAEGMQVGEELFAPPAEAVPGTPAETNSDPPGLGHLPRNFLPTS
jgi:hypothetical protein